MSYRLSSGGLLINRNAPARLRFNGRSVDGFEGDTIASALLGAGRVLMGRSFKYHRPRGPVSAGAEEANALVGLGRGAGFEPNVRATVAPLREGAFAVSQNHFPALAFDLGALNARLARFFPAGFYYKTFIHPRAAWKHLFEPFIRRTAGLGRAPAAADADSYEYFYFHCDVLVAGGGIAGLLSAREAARAGARVLIAEQAGWWGGRAFAEGKDAEIAALVAELGALGNVTLRLNATVAAAYDHGYALVNERLYGGEGPAQRLWRVRAGRIIAATGAIERPLVFAGNDIPGVMLASAARDYAALWGVALGQRVVVATTGDDGYRSALALAGAGVSVTVLDARAEAAGSLPQAARAMGITIHAGSGPVNARGGKALTGVDYGPSRGSGEIAGHLACEGLAMSNGWSPAVHLWSQSGGRLLWDAERAMFRPDPAKPPTGADGRGFVLCAGAANGDLTDAACRADACSAGRRAAEELSFKSSGIQDKIEPDIEDSGRPFWIMPALAGSALRSKAFVDFQHDVKASDIALAAREGYVSVEHAKRYTTLGMATDQGKLSNINGLALLAEALDRAIPEVGTTTFRPPYTPVTFGSVAGEARGRLFKPIRRTAMDALHMARRPRWEPVGDWRRVYSFPKPGETVHDAVAREVTATRTSVGMLDASTLGKLLVKGPDAGRFLDLIYTNVMSSLPVGKCRYGLMCNENGFLFDDGVVARLGEQEFLCHTTSGGADRVHGWLEEWLQTEWWDFKVYVANLTEQFAQVAVAGPKARAVLEKLGGMDVSREALPQMGWAEGRLGGFPARIYRISFSGELSYEIAVPAGQGSAFWQAVAEAGSEFGITPYGTEALHVMRAEKGYIMIGDETDGTVIPQDLGLSWAVSKKKTDYLGKRAHERAFFARKDRKQLVGLLTLEPDEVLPDGAHAVEGGLRRDGTGRAIGHVTSSYFSPTLKRSIAMALIEGGETWLGQVLTFSLGGGKVMRAKVVKPLFYDPEGTRLND